MSQSPPREHTDSLSELFVEITGDETVTEPQETDAPDRELPAETGVESALVDGLADAIDGAEPDTGDPGE